MATKQKHILVIVESIDVNDSSASKGRVSLIKNLVEIGLKLTVLHYTRKEIYIEGVTCKAVPENRTSFLFLLSRIQRLLQRFLKVNLAKRLEPLFGFSFTYFNDVNSIKSALKGINFSEINYVLTLSKAASFRPHYVINKMPELHNKWLAYIHDPYPFSCYPKPYNYNEPGYKIKEQFFKDVTLNAKHTVFPSLLLKEWMGSFFDNCNRTGLIIPHQNSELDFVGIKVPEYFDSSKFNLLHAGGLLNARNPEWLLKGLNLFFLKFPMCRNDVRLIFIGKTTGFSNMLRDFKKDNPELIVVDRMVSFNEVYCLQMQASVNIILEAKSDISPFLPGKFPHCVAANKKIISLSPLHSEVRRLLGHKYPYASEIDDANKISNIIEDLYFLWKENPDNLLLNRQDLDYYLSEKYLTEVINKLDVLNE